MVYGIVRWQATLDWLIAAKPAAANKSPACKTCCASAFTRFSGSTAFPTTPPSTKPSNSPNATPASARRPDFVNAVLRGYLRERRRNQKLLADLKISQPATRLVASRMAGRPLAEKFGAEKTAQLLEWNNTPPKPLRASTL
jgi:hypothetical protein